MEFHLIHGKGRDFHFPVPFEEFEFTQDGKSETKTLLNFGDINVTGSKALREITLDGFFPAKHYPFCQVEPKEPIEYIDTLQWLKDVKAVVIFVITGTSVYFQCTLESFSWGMKSGTKDIYFRLGLKEFRPLR